MRLSSSDPDKPDQRVIALDDPPSEYRESVLGNLVHFIHIMEWINGCNPDRPRVSPEYADATLSRSHLLACLEKTTPEIAIGPLHRDAQYWMNGGTSSRYRTRQDTLDRAHYISVIDAPRVELSTKPFFVGLFTCTGVLGTYGMWRLYVDRYRDGAGPTAYERPWETWAVEIEPDARVLELASAADWVDFVLSHPRQSGQVLYPDWRAVAQRYDAVHMTLRAIAATQGLFFPTEQGEVAPTFWDVESTLWLRWRFGSVRLVETVR
jgi:hypothetical protein